MAEKLLQTLLLNYRKSGEPFENLLTMRFVCDNLGRRRFSCGGYQRAKRPEFVAG